MKPEHITAWALNELSTDDRAQIESELKESHTLLEQVHETEAFCSLLTRHLGAGEASLTSEQHEALLSGLPQPSNPTVLKSLHAVNGHPTPLSAAPIRRSVWRHPAFIGISAAAACWATYMGVTMLQTNDDTAVAHAEGKLLSFKVQAQRGAAGTKYNDSGDTLALKPTEPKFTKMDDLTKVGGGELTLSDTNTYTGGTVISGGTTTPSVNGTGELKVQQNNASGYLTASTKVGGFAISGSVSSLEPTPAVGGYDNSDRGSGPNFLANPIIPSQPVALGFGGTETFDPPQIPATLTPSANTERYALLRESAFMEVARDPLSTFGADVDSASYANVRRFLNEKRLPPVDAVRIEELVNYFPYDYEAPAKDSVQPFRVQVDVAEAPWAPQHRLARIAIKGKDIGTERVTANFVFLVDVSGSMDDPAKLPLVQRSLTMLTEQLADEDRVAIVTYAGQSGLALESTVGADRAKIKAAITALKAGGSTNGASGIELAYAEAQRHFIKEGVNRVILCTDGDFNVGISSPAALETLIKDKAQGGTFLSVLGYGTGNLQDHTMMTLADKGNGNYAYIDSLSEARKVLVEQMHGTLVTIAKDVKIQVEFNPAIVSSYRLLGYEKRSLAKEDFNNDRKDAGEIGAGHTVTALYEIVPMDARTPNDLPLVDDLKYQPKEKKEVPTMAGVLPLKKLEGINDEVMTVKLRYKAPDGDLSKLIEVPVKDAKTQMKDAPKDFQFAAAVVGFGLMLRDSEHKGSLTWEQVRKLALSGKGEDALGYRGEFVQLIDRANGLSGRP